MHDDSVHEISVYGSKAAGVSYDGNALEISVYGSGSPLATRCLIVK